MRERRHPGAKFVAMTIKLRPVNPEYLGPGYYLCYLRLFFYSPLDQAVLEYQQVFDEKRATTSALALDPQTLGVYDDYKEVRREAEANGIPIPKDFDQAPPLVQPWTRFNLKDALFTAWTLAGKPPVVPLFLSASSRTPYDFEIVVSQWIIVDGINYFRKQT